MDWQTVFGHGLKYAEFLDVHGSVAHRERWKAVHDQISLTDAQKTLLSGFSRQMNVLCLAGTWCGDCVNQCPILQRFAEACPRIDLRFLDRDQHADVQRELSINGGHRVPVVVFLSEDCFECGRYGERTLSTYRHLAETLLGPACPTGTGKQDQSLITSVTADWLAEFERMQILLRLSTRLRAMHGD